MLIHAVRFYAAPGLDDAGKAALRRGLESLRSIPQVEQLFIGAPAATEKRPVIDDAYVMALTIVFKDISAHDAYQVHPVHLQFVEQCRRYWERVAIFDAE